MEYPKKVTAETGPVHRDGSTESQPDVASSPLVDQLEENYPCQDLPNHLRGRYPLSFGMDLSGEEDYSCNICHKVLSSASSLDRHILVHSGERPFKCKYCEIAFTTNGNMNRHLRTAHHGVSPAHSCTDSEGGSTDSEKISHQLSVQEFNNNEIRKRKLSEDEKSPQKAKRTFTGYEADSRSFKYKLGMEYIKYPVPPNIYNCPACDREFSNHEEFNAHVDLKHYERFRDNHCTDQQYNDSRMANSIASNHSHSVVGFKDCTFTDFSSGKFPAIARAVCEQSVHRPASGEMTKFLCSKCLRAFPCRAALDSHELACGLPQHNHRNKDDQSMKDNFFTGLDLQNKASLNEAKEGKDLADIQSILSVTSSPILQNFGRSDVSTPDNCNTKMNHHMSSSGSSGTPSSEYHEEEHQDSMAAEFKKMKAKGEFPCRLCDRICANLRALKGHNREHMSVAPGEPYACSMCPVTCNDKAALTKHLRTHNGERPYECALCSYAFTTKANCERHIRNRHGKVTKDEVKSLLLYHPSEDSSNNDAMDRSSPRGERLRSGDEVRKSLVYPPECEPAPIQQQVHHSSGIRVRDESSLRKSHLPAVHNAPSNNYNQSEILMTPVMHSLNMTYDACEKADNSRDIAIDPIPKDEEDYDSGSSEESISLVNDTKVDYQRTQMTAINLKKHPEQTPANEDAPLDLSMDVLDLSKKPKEKNSEMNGNIENLDNKQNEGHPSTNRPFLGNALLNAGTSVESLYNRQSLFYRNYMESWNTMANVNLNGGLLQPYLLNPHILNTEFALREKLQKDFVRGLQTSGGTLVEPVGGSSPGFGTGFSSAPRHISEAPVTESNDFSTLMSPKMNINKCIPPREKMDSTSSSNSVKMVIKNGILMPKQKQRRYRTEKPFSCEHCAARFTLRSNMERHIKQQHPQHWSQRPRGGHATRGRPPSHPPTMLPNLGSRTTLSANSYSNTSRASIPQNSHMISDQLKYAILAQQLKNNKNDENETDEELVIDEEANSQRKLTSERNAVPSERTISLLRGKLEENAETKESTGQKMSINATDRSQETKREKQDGDSEGVVEHDDDCAYREQDVKEEMNCDNVSDSSSHRPTSDFHNSNENVNHEVAVKREKSENEDLASVSELLDNASQQYQQFQPQYLSDEEGLIASTSEGNPSGSEDKSDSINSGNSANSASSLKKKKKKKKKKSAYSLAPNRVICPYCQRPFPWTSSLRRHILTHTGQKPYRCMYCSLLFTTKSNCDRHLMRKHKANPNKIRRVRNQSSPEPQDVATNNSSFSMRNVPERPYKCNQCPSSTFSTMGNLKKHRSTKHSRTRSASKSRPESPVSEPQNSSTDCPKQNDQSGYESQSSGVSEHMETNLPPNNAPKSQLNLFSPNETPKSRKTSPTSSPSPTDHPYKCHLCDCGFAERQECLDHIKDNHRQSYDMLVAKGALDMDIDGVEEQQPPPAQNPSDGEEKRGKFPDYTNRKVICSFCVRRFWSAEDLRRHVRTHTGEKPFSCDICNRRFTLKHSMLRHRKNHKTSSSPMYVGTSGDEDQAGPNQPAAMVATASTSRVQDRVSLPTVVAVATGDAAPSGLSLRFNPYERRATLTAASSNDQILDDNQKPITAVNQDANSVANRSQTDNASQNSSLGNNHHENDLISNLLGLRDSSIVDKVLQASPDDAAIILGVKGCHD